MPIELLKPGEQPKNKTTYRTTTVESLFKNAIRYERLTEASDGIDGIRAVLNFAGVSKYPQSEVADKSINTLSKIREELPKRKGLTYAGKSVSYYRLIQNLGVYTNVAEEEELYAIDFMSI